MLYTYNKYTELGKIKTHSGDIKLKSNPILCTGLYNNIYSAVLRNSLVLG